MNKVILFDFDGTIADTFDNFLLIINQLSEKYKFPKFNHDQILKLRDEDARTFLKNLKVPFYRIPFLIRDFKKMQNQIIKNVKPFANISEEIHKLKIEGYKIGILTSNSKENIASFNIKYELDIFDYIFTDIGLFGKSKAINRFIKNNRLNRDEIIYVGDEIRDIKACKVAGIRIISVTWGFNSKEGLLKNNPDSLCESPKELLKIIRVNFDHSNNT